MSKKGSKKDGGMGEEDGIPNPEIPQRKDCIPCPSCRALIPISATRPDKLVCRCGYMGPPKLDSDQEKRYRQLERYRDNIPSEQNSIDLGFLPR